MAYRTHNDNSFLPRKKKYERYVAGIDSYSLESGEGGNPIVLPLSSAIGGNAFPSGIRFIRPNDPTISVAEIFFTVTLQFTARQITGVFTTSQPGDAPLVATLRKNGVDTAITFTINATFQNPVPSVGSVLYLNNDTLSIKINNLSASASGLCTSITVS